MDALSMAALDPPSVPSRLAGESELSPRLRAALAILLQAHDYARDLEGNPWDFATEIANLRRLKLSNSDFRWLVGRGYVDHGIEVSLGSDLERRFQHPGRLLFSKKTCFVLTPAGAALASELARGANGVRLAESLAASDPPRLAIAEPPRPRPPHWDCNRQELRVGSSVVKQFKIPSDAEQTILAAFEEMHWPVRIDDPLPQANDSSRWRLQQAIEALNQNQKHALIRFVGDGTGRGVLWEFRGENAAST
ncbi:MAG TPA: hypothetical protein VFW87_17485 [Pirellulales bacterium]|nr:hypothetical protein [Pirellulales bacterium]